LWGYTTSTDLTKMGNFLFMGMVGIMIAMLVNIFLGSSMVMFVVSVLGVLIFTGLTAYDVQNLKNDYLNYGEVLGFDSPEKSALYGAFSLYLNFINIFQFLLNLLGDRD
jgi:FtsH-binding integral membrane protein